MRVPRLVPAFVIPAIIMLAAIPSTLGQDVIRTIAIGQVGPIDCPIHAWFSALPDFEYTLVVTTVADRAKTVDELRRWVRLYLPRTRDELADNFDHYILVDCWMTGTEGTPLITGKQLADIKWSVGDEGLAVFATGIWSRQSSSGMVSALLDSIMEEYFPVDLSGPRVMTNQHVYKVTVNRDEALPPVLKVFIPLGIESFQGIWIGQLYPKQGATIWATVRETNMPRAPPGGFPWLVSWRVGAAQTMFWVAADDLEVKWWWGFFNPPTENPYGVDILANMIYHSLGKSLPKDMILVHGIRRRLIEFNDKKILALSVIEFAEKFKANTGPLWRDLALVEEVRAKANNAYLLHGYAESSEILREAEEGILELGNRAVELKDASLLWVFIIEWLAVAATSMMCGMVLWTLMIKRRLYREIRTTRGEMR